MALDTLAQTMLLMKADVSDLREKLKTVAESEKASVKASIAAAEERNKSLDKWAERLTKVNTALDVVSKAVSFGAEAWKVYDEQAKLRAQSAAYSLEGLRRASIGVKTDTELMRLAVAASTTTFKLNQAQLENVLLAQQGWEDQGKDSAKVANALEKAITEGSIAPLKELGVNLEIAQGKGAQFAQMLKVIAEQAQVGKKHQVDANDEFQRAGVAWSNSMTQLKESIGKMVIGLEPLISALGSVVGLVGKLVSVLPPELLSIIIATGAGAYLKSKGGKGGTLGRVGGALPVLSTAVELGKIGGEWYGDNYQNSIVGSAGNAATGYASAAFEERNNVWRAKLNAAEEKELNAQIAEIERAGARNIKLLGAFAPPKKKGGGGGGGGDTAGSPIGFVQLDGRGTVAPIWDLPTRDYFGTLQAKVGGAAQGSLGQAIGGSSSGDSAAMGVGLQFAGLADGMQGVADEFARAGNRYGAEQTYLQSIFGDVDQFDAYAEGFAILSNAMQSSFDGWVSGSLSAGQAVKAFFAQAISGVASTMFAQALQHAAFAIGSLAFQDYRGAAVHAKAAAAFGAGALVVGGIARQLNGSASVGAAPNVAGAGSSASSAGASAGAREGGGRHATIVIGDSFADDSPRMRQRNIARAVRRANREMDQGVSDR